MLDHGVTAIYEGGYIDRVPFESLNFEKKPGAVSVSGSWLEIE